MVLEEIHPLDARLLYQLDQWLFFLFNYDAVRVLVQPIDCLLNFIADDLLKLLNPPQKQAKTLVDCLAVKSFNAWVYYICSWNVWKHVLQEVLLADSHLLIGFFPALLIRPICICSHRP